VILVNGGSVVNLMAVWRAHGLPAILRECWETGVGLAGWSAGSVCWHLGGPTDSYRMRWTRSWTGWETSVDNNAYQISMTIAGTGTIRGTIWRDLDRDGQREVGEPPIGSGPDGVQRLVIIPRNAGATGSTGVSEVRRYRSQHSEEPEVGIGLRG
jgi:hypothetical protein